ncbi:hypothetical protein [Nonomuraea aurantiaca]|uniref:hypothetical protein n=1 Tax=Nonomuraea aurantiaca TaxID=2878562 RepID=UPI001CD94101|nr:hypothetical protein [Nonomuraea aurantiaca]MCA2223186.1 hypothetical protein [Nonomuraea aurantiaca]
MNDILALPTGPLADVMHDLGLGTLAAGQARFEVEGADLAASVLTEHGIAAADVDRVWEAIALHSSVGIADRRGLLTYPGTCASDRPKSDLRTWSRMRAESGDQAPWRRDVAPGQRASPWTDARHVRRLAGGAACRTGWKVF